MQKYRALLLGGVCLGLVSIQAGTRIFAADEAPAEAPAAAAEPQAPAAAEEAAPPAAEAAPPMSPPGVTWYSGDTTPASPPAFAAEATMNPDYSATAPVEAPAAAEAAPAEAAPAAAETPEAAPVDAPAAEAPAAEAPATTAAATEEPAPPMTPSGVTWYSGDTTPASPPAFAAEAAMNPDYTAEAPVPAPVEAPAAVAAPEAPAAVAAEEPAPPMTPPGETLYFGETAPASPPAWAAEATVFPSAPEAAPATQAAVEACRDALNAEAQAGKINFATSAWDVLPDSFKTLDKIAKVAKDCASNFVIEVGGHTDNTGKPASNKTISELRAQSVVKYLSKAGVDAAKLKAVGYGQDKPVGDNATVAGRRENRRIAFTVAGG